MHSMTPPTKGPRGGAAGGGGVRGGGGGGGGGSRKHSDSHSNGDPFYYLQ